MTSLDTAWKLVQFPKDYQDRTKNLSPHELYKQSGYGSHRNLVTIEQIREILLEKPEWIDLWLQYSGDKRHSPAWAFLLDPKTNNYLVGYHGSTFKYTVSFSDKLLGCAFFIKMEFEDLSQFH